MPAREQLNLGGHGATSAIEDLRIAGVNAQKKRALFFIEARVVARDTAGSPASS
jgi:hypothetical protein